MSQRAASNLFQRSLGRLSGRSSTGSTKGNARTYSSSTTTGGQPRYDVTGTTLVLAFIPILTFGLGTWQIKRLQWKVNLIDELEEKLSKRPMPLPSKIDTSAIPEFAYRKVELSGHFDHSREVLLGPRTRESVLGYQVVTPFIRDGDDASNAVLVNRGQVSMQKKDQANRPESLISGEQTIVGMLRDQEPRNAFSPANSPEKKEYQFMDIAQMATATGTQPVMVDEIYDGNAGEMKSMITHGIPIGRASTIELRNMHATYAATWYALSAATTLMLWRLLRKPPSRANAFSRFDK